MMEEESIRLGNIPKKVIQMFHLKGNINVVVWNKTLDELTDEEIEIIAHLQGVTLRTIL